ncbi:MAG: HAD family hydrolase [Rhodobacterales bacterium]|nr:HAD family hydrolase [Rhodobacterales bacterium]
MSVDLILFDCDGVLVDSEPIAARVLAELLTELGHPHTRDDCYDRYTGISLAAVKARVEADAGRPLPEDFIDRLTERDAAAFTAELRAMPGVADVLAGLAVPFCVASSGTLAKIRRSLRLTGLDGPFGDRLYSAQMVTRGKPAPDLFLLAAEGMGAAPERCLVIEDSAAGVTAARAAGMAVLGFAGGGHCGPGHGEMLRNAGAPLVFDAMADLPGLLAAL